MHTENYVKMRGEWVNDDENVNSGHLTNVTIQSPFQISRSSSHNTVAAALDLLCTSVFTSEIFGITIVNLQHKVVNFGVSSNFKANIWKKKVQNRMTLQFCVVFRELPFIHGHSYVILQQHWLNSEWNDLSALRQRGEMEIIRRKESTFG